MKVPNLRTANAALVASMMAAAYPAPYVAGQEVAHGTITSANAALFTEAHFSEPLTTYATGWRDPNGYQAVSDFIAPPVVTPGEYFEFITYPNAEAFLSDDLVDDLRPIGGDFKTVDYTQDKDRKQIPNRGLRIVLDWDRVKNMPNWQQFFTGRLLERLQRSGFRRKSGLAIASGTGATLTWGTSGSPHPDLDIAKQAKLSGDASGITPNRALWGLAAALQRYEAYGVQNNAQGYAGANKSPEEACAKFGIAAKVDESRYQTGATKTSIIGAKIVLFTAESQSAEDPSNFKTAIGTTAQGGRYAVYVRQISVKQWEIVVETYETEWCASTLGVRTLTIASS